MLGLIQKDPELILRSIYNLLKELKLEDEGDLIMTISEAILNGTLTKDPELIKGSVKLIMKKLIKLFLPQLTSQIISDFYSITAEGELKGLPKMFERLDLKESKYY